MSTEIHRMQTIVANEICGQASKLSPDEFEFLCDITGTKLNDASLKGRRFGE